MRDNYALLAGAPQAQKFGMADMEPIEKLIAWAKRTYPINPRRIYMFGKGEGGKISAEFAMTHPQLVTAAITHSWGFWVMPSEVNVEPSAEELAVLKKQRDVAHIVDGHFPELVLVGGMVAGNMVDDFLQAKDETVLVAATETVRRGWFAEKTIAELAELTADPSALVRQSAIHALGILANWRSSPAHQALIALAMNSAAELNEPDQRHGCVGIRGAAAGAGRTAGSSDVPSFGGLTGGQGRAGACFSRRDPGPRFSASEYDSAVESSGTGLGEVAGRIQRETSL